MTFVKCHTKERMNEKKKSVINHRKERMKWHYLNV